MVTIMMSNTTINIKKEYVIIGDSNILSGDYGNIIGNHNRITGNHNRINGNDNCITGNHNKSIGDYNQLTGSDLIVVGGFNKLFTLTDSDRKTIKIRGVGNIIKSMDYIPKNTTTKSILNGNNKITFKTDTSTIDVNKNHNHHSEKKRKNRIKEKEEEPILKKRKKSDDENADKEDKEPCVICLERKRKCAAMPCKHFRYCNTCCLELEKNKKNMKCSICQKDVDYFESFY